MKTGLVRDSAGNLKVFRREGYRTNLEFTEDLRNNGYRVLKVWAGDKSDAFCVEWERLNRRG